MPETRVPIAALSRAMPVMVTVAVVSLKVTAALPPPVMLTGLAPVATSATSVPLIDRTSLEPSPTWLTDSVRLVKVCPALLVFAVTLLNRLTALPSSV